MNINIVLKKIDTLIVWILLLLFLVFMVSGYMITRGFLHRYYGLLLHIQLDLPIMFFFILHAFINIRFFIIRSKVRHKQLLQIVSILVGVLMFIFIIYLDQFFGLQR
ncbi:hypothetical protein [[Eubacterium] cellulosolvens]